LLRTLALVFVAASMLPGCAVPQRPGKGSVMHLREPQTKSMYWLYLPADYVEAHKDAKITSKKYPLVMTFHGMKPFDNAHSQIVEWQQEADRYGFVVCAPELQAPDLYSPVPLKKVWPPLLRDEKAILATMDEVMRTTDVNPSAVLATSWSYGGYLAHYMMNRHPARFTCLAVRQSNFSADILDPKQVDQYRDHKVAVFYTENDFAICQRESQEAALWYSKLGFNLTFREFGEKGHERTPSLAAAFFASDCGAEAKSPPTELAQLQVRDVPVLDRTNGRVAGVTAASDGVDRSTAQGPQPKLNPAPQPIAPSQTQSKQTPPQQTVLASSSSGYNLYSESASGTRTPTASPPPAERKPANEVLFPRPIESANPIRTRPAKPATAAPSAPVNPAPRRAEPPPSIPTEISNPVRVRLSSTIGIAPLLVSYSAAVPNRFKEHAYFLWTDNGEPMSNGLNGQKFFTEPGEHEIEVLVTTRDGQEFRAASSVTVLERISSKGGQ
jgi:hypothetical protein